MEEKSVAACLTVTSRRVAAKRNRKLKLLLKRPNQLRHFLLIIHEKYIHVKSFVA